MELPIVKKQLDLNYIQTTIPKLGLDKIVGIKLPPIPSIQKQQEIVDYISETYTQKQAKEAEAQQLLDSIDGYLLKELGINVIASSGNADSVADRIFVKNLRELERDRFDSNYYANKYNTLLRSIRKGIYPLYILGDSNITSFLSVGQTPKSEYYSDTKTDFPIIKAGCYTGSEIDLSKVSFTINKQAYTIKKGDIFILSAAHQAEYIAKQICYLHDTPKPNTSFVGELLCVRASETINSMYLYSVLSTKVYKTLLNREKRGQTSHLYAQDVKQLFVPIPPIAKQNCIAKHIEELRTRAKALQAEGKAILEDAKRKIEQMIIDK